MSEYWISIAFSVLFQVVKNTAHVAASKQALKKLRDILVTLPLDT